MALEEMVHWNLFQKTNKSGENDGFLHEKYHRRVQKNQ